MPDQQIIKRTPQDREDKRPTPRKNELIRGELPLFEDPPRGGERTQARRSKPAPSTKPAKSAALPRAAKAGARAASSSAEARPAARSSGQLARTGGRAAAAGRTGRTPAASAKKASAKTSRVGPARRATTASRTKKK